MKFKKFVIIPILILVYVFSVKLFSHPQHPSFSNNFFYIPKGSLIEKIPIGDAVAVYVTRPYLLGLVRLPVQINEIKIGWMHNLFFNIFIPTLFLIFVFLEVINLKEGSKMKVDWKGVGKSLLVWIVVSLVIYLLSGSDSSIGIGFLIAYLEYKFRNKTLIPNEKPLETELEPKPKEKNK